MGTYIKYTWEEDTNGNRYYYNSKGLPVFDFTTKNFAIPEFCETTEVKYSCKPPYYLLNRDGSKTYV